MECSEVATAMLSSSMWQACLMLAALGETWTLQDPHACHPQLNDVCSHHWLMHTPQCRFKLQQLYGCPELARLMVWHASAEAQEMLGGEDIIADIIDGEAYKQARRCPPFSQDARHVYIMIAHDPFLPFRHYSQRYSCHPFMCTFVNLPPDVSGKWVRRQAAHASQGSSVAQHCITPVLSMPLLPTLAA